MTQELRKLAEKAILAKELPEPVVIDRHIPTNTVIRGYTAAQLHEAHAQGFAAGAAAQLAEKPSGWMCQSRKHADQCCIAMNPQTSNDFTEVTELYKRREA